MDYQFYQDGFGSFIAKLELGQEATARFLTEEVGQNRALICSLLAQIELIKDATKISYYFQGKEFELTLTLHQIEIQANLLADNFDHNELDQETFGQADYFDQELTSVAGLEDFETLLKAWLDYIQ
ncbi:YacL family protein [Aliikangiella sp. IMCC44632]